MTGIEFLAVSRAVIGLLLALLCARAGLWWLTGAWFGLCLVGVLVAFGVDLLTVNAVATAAYALLAAHTLTTTKPS